MTNAEYKTYMLHEALLKDLCINLIGCGSCNGCHPIACMHAIVNAPTETGFQLDIFDHSTNDMIIRICLQNGYHADIISTNDNNPEYINIYKKESAA